MKIKILFGVVLVLAGWTSSMAGTDVPTMANEVADLSVSVADDQVELKWPACDKALHTYGYLIQIWDRDPRMIDSVAKGAKLKVYYLRNRHFFIPHLRANRTYFVAMGYILESERDKNNVALVDPRPWNAGNLPPTMSVHTSKAYRARQLSETEESLPIPNVKLQVLYDDPDAYVGKIIRVEGYFNIFNSPFKSRGPESLILGELVLRSDESITDGTVKMLVPGELADGAIYDRKMMPNYVKLIGYFNNKLIGRPREWYLVQQKPGYFFQPLLAEEYLRK